MPTQLRAVLDTFSDADAPLSLADLARRLEIEPGILEGMIAYWVRKGRLREVWASCVGSCSRCGSAGSCVFVVPMPRTYELVREALDVPLKGNIGFEPVIDDPPDAAG